MEKKFVEFDFYHLPHKKLSDGMFSEKNLVIFDGVSDIIIKYVIVCLRNILYLRSSDNTLIYQEPLNIPLEKKFNELQMYVASVKRTYSINFLDNQVQNLSFNSFLHIIVCLTDWLETENISDVEINTALHFILTKDMRKVFKGWIDEYSNIINKNKKNNKFLDYYNLSLSQIIYIFKKYDLNIDIKSAELLIKYIFVITYNINKVIEGKEGLYEKTFLDRFTDVFKELFSF
jgi:ankyrin repeat protein